MSVEWFTRMKPTKHKQSCMLCDESMEKNKIQTVRKEMEWGYGRAYTNLRYWHPTCAMKELLDSDDFKNHFSRAYSKDLSAKTFKEVFDNRTWMSYTAQYITAPFEVFASLHLLKDEDAEKFLEEVFTGIVFDKVMRPANALN